MLGGSLEADPPPGVSDVDGMRIVRYRLPRRRWDLRGTAAEEDAMKAAAGTALDGGWDVLHGHAPLSALAAASLLGRERASRRVYTLHSPVRRELAVNAASSGAATRASAALKGALLGRVERRVLERSDGVQVLSNYSRGLVAELHGRALAERSEIIPWFVETDAASLVSRDEACTSLGWARDAFHVLTVRRLVWRMGVDALVRANAGLPGSSPIHVHVVGDGPERASLERLARSGARDGQMTFHGGLPQPAVDLMYAAADAFVLPTVSLEGFGLIILEALGAGIPVIGTDVGAIPEVLSRVSAGTVVAAADPGALGGALQRCVEAGTPPTRRAEIAGEARRTFPRAATLDRYETFLRGARH